MIGAAAAVVALGVLALPSLAAKDDLDLISRATGGAATDGGSSEASISADGRHVAFTSDADNLSDEDDNEVPNVFLRDTVAGTTILVDRVGSPNNFSPDSSTPSISADGRFIALEIGKPTQEQIQLRDTTTVPLELVSRASGLFPAGNKASLAPSISADGRFVAFESAATNLVNDDDKAVSDIFVRDTVALTTTLVSRASGPEGEEGDGASLAPSISADGRFVAFGSSATNLSNDDLGGTSDIFVRDLVSSTTTLVSRVSSATGAAGDDDSYAASISADGNRVAFTSRADNLTSDISASSSGIFVRDLAAASTTLVSRASGAGGAVADSGSEDPAISADGRFVAFQSDATDLSDADGDPVGDVFVRDLAGAVTTLVSRAAGPAGAGASDGSFRPAISGDGRFVAFESGADNLSAESGAGVSDVFRRDVLGTPPTPLAPLPGPSPTVTGGPTRITARCSGALATIVGTNGANVIRGTARRDVIAALGGDDVVRGLGGDDLICLGAGNDRGIGGAGADRILGGPGRDILLGGPGIDTLLGLGGRDIARGGRGRDVCTVEAKQAC